MEFTSNFNGNRGRLPGRSQRARAGRQVRRRARHRPGAQQRLLRPPERRGVAPLRLRARHDRTRRERDHSLRRRPGRSPYTKTTRARAPGNFANSSCTSCRGPPARCSAPATSTRSRSTTARSARGDDRRPLRRATQHSRRRPSFTARRTRPRPASRSSFDGSASSDPDGTIAKYEWDLDGNGSYETNTGTTADDDPHLRHRGHGDRRPAGHRQRRATPATSTRSRHRRGVGGAGYVRQSRARHRRPDRLLAPGRGRRARPWPTARAGAGHRSRAAPTLGVARRPCRTTPTPRSASTAPTTPPSRQPQPLRHQQA